jgi:hypothetical protein
MDELIWKQINETCCYEASLYEGLNKTHDLKTINKILIKKYGKENLIIDYKNNNFSLLYKFSSDPVDADEQLDKLLQYTNNLGWFPSNVTYGTNFSKNVKWGKSIIKELFTKSIQTLKFSFEPKYDIKADATLKKYYYHMTPTLYVDKILKNGLIPKSRSKKTYHPDRIYLSDNPQSLLDIIPEFALTTDILDWSIIEVYTGFIDMYLQLYKDQNFKERGFYTLNTITPECLSLYNSYILSNDKETIDIIQNDKLYSVNKINRAIHVDKRGLKKNKGDKTPNFGY